MLHDFCFGRGYTLFLLWSRINQTTWPNSGKSSSEIRSLFYKISYWNFWKYNRRINNVCLQEWKTLFFPTCLVTIILPPSVLRPENNNSCEISHFPVSKQIVKEQFSLDVLGKKLFLVAGHKVDLIAPRGGNKSIFWPHSRKKSCATRQKYLFYSQNKFFFPLLHNILFTVKVVHSRKIRPQA